MLSGSSIRLGGPHPSPELKNLRPNCPFTRDLFSRASAPSACKSLIFLHRVPAAQVFTSDNDQSVKLG